LRHAVRTTRLRHPFTTEAWVVLPDHLHTVWTLPDGDVDFPTRWSLIKRLFSHALPPGESRSASRIAKRERGLWQRRFWEHLIRDDGDFRAHTDYVHFNPVRHKLVSHPADWPYSTFHRAVRRGQMPPNWAGPEHPEHFGERLDRDETPVGAAP
jgi:putative transposase